MFLMYSFEELLLNRCDFYNSKLVSYSFYQGWCLRWSESRNVQPERPFRLMGNTKRYVLKLSLICLEL